MNSFLRFNSIAIGKRYAICKPLFQFLWENHIKFVVMKGAVLSQAAYGNFAIRKSSDIDLFVSRDCIDQVKKHLLDLGFVQGRVTAKGIVPFNRADLIFYTTQSHQLAPFVKRVGGSLLQYINCQWNNPKACLANAFTICLSSGGIDIVNIEVQGDGYQITTDVLAKDALYAGFENSLKNEPSRL